MQLELLSRTSHRSRPRVALVALVVLSTLIAGAATAAAAVQPGPVDLGAAELGKRGPEIPLWFTNPAPQPITMAATRVEGPDAGDFEVREDGCVDRVLQPGEKCVAFAELHPRAAGVRHARVVFSQAGESGVSDGVALTGTGLEIVPLHVDFGQRPLFGSPTERKVTYTNRGSSLVQLAKPRLEADADSGFRLGADDCVSRIAPGASCAATVSFAPTSAGPKHARLVFGSAAGVTVWTTTEIVGEGKAPLDPASVTFDDQALGRESAARAVVFTNWSEQRLNGPQPTLTGDAADQFDIEEDDCSGGLIEPGAGCNVRVRFAPTSEGHKEAGLRFGGLVEAPAGLSAALAGNAVNPVEPLLVNFSTTAVGASGNTHEVSVSNPTDQPLRMGGVTVEGVDAGNFKLTQKACENTTIAPGGHCSVTVEFSPRSAGSMRAVIRFGSPLDERSPFVAGLKGTGVETVDASSLELGERPIGLRAETTGRLTFTSRFEGSIFVVTPRVEGADAADFTVRSGRCGNGAVILPAESCLLEVVFVPTAPGEKRATLVLAYRKATGDLEEQRIALSGTATAFVPASVDLGIVSPGAAGEPALVTWTNLTSKVVLLGKVSLEGPDATDVRVVSDRCSRWALEPGSSCSMLVALAPSSVGRKHATLRFAPDVGPEFDVSTALAGTAGDPAAPQRVEFPDTGALVGASEDTVRFNNLTDELLRVADVRITGADPTDFRVDARQCKQDTLRPGESCVVRIAFRPASTGAKRATLRFESSSARLLAPEVPLSGMGRSLVDRTELAFADRDVGAKGPTGTVVFTNLTASPVRLVPGVVGTDHDDFAVQAHSCALVKPGESCWIDVAFTPHSVGGKEAQLDLRDADGLELAHVALHARGVASPGGGQEHTGTAGEPQGGGGTPAEPVGPPAQPAGGPRLTVRRGRRVIAVGPRAPRCLPKRGRVKVRADGATRIELRLRRRRDVRRVTGCKPRITRRGPKRTSPVLARSLRGVRDGSLTLRVGRRLLGRRLRPGVYELQLRARDAAGQRSAPVTVTVVVSGTRAPGHRRSAS